MALAKSITIISSPYHLGVRDAAVGAGPTALLAAGFADAIQQQGIAVRVVELESVEEFDGEIGRLFELLRRTSKTVTQVVQQNSFPILLAGNCSTTVGVQAGYAAARNIVPSCVWFDAHDDFNTPDVLASGYLDSMPVAMLAGLGWKTLLASIPGFKPLDLQRQLVHCGMRDVTELERSRVVEARFPVIWGDTEKQVDFEGELHRLLKDKKLGETMVHLDLDALDTSVGNVNKFSAPGGLLEDDLERCLRMIPSESKPVSLTIASYDPSFDKDRRIPPVAINGVVAFVKSLIAQGFLEGTSETASRAI
ncbi:hypothetical protein PFICI_14215 [Pestalotiopsis fici W106-1]|uniref:Arginase n=1 Tax=Pestalotiopsis fici (strain W106-1 / CGMCC3.15140) TaxID=1229662 RepID=W3WKT6_PESFW|nr:uncharacterized protein PFICI_14215 [Pestalotiopsis fici W106-1]ETS74349.1 hypothetical protein PFICI_14215 [Pestalotiopsis fici W106-1]